MRNNPSLDQLTEAYVDRVVGSVPAPGIVLEIEPEPEEGCSGAAQGCECGGCSECQCDDTSEDDVVQDCIVKLEDLLQSMHRLYGRNRGDQSQFNMGHEDTVEL